MFLEIDLARELPDIARAMALMRDDTVFEERKRRLLSVLARIAFSVALALWLGAYLALPVIFGGYGWAFVACVAVANVARAAQLGFAVPPDLDTDAKRLPAGIKEVLQFAGAMAFLFPMIAFFGIRLMDSRLRRRSAQVEHVYQILSDPRWSDMRRLWSTLELYNLAVGTRDDYELMALLDTWAGRCKPEATALVEALAIHAAVTAPLLLEARNLTHCRPFGHARNAPPTDFSRRVADLDLATGAIVAARARFLDRIRDLSDDGAA